MDQSTEHLLKSTTNSPLFGISNDLNSNNDNDQISPAPSTPDMLTGFYQSSIPSIYPSPTNIDIDDSITPTPPPPPPVAFSLGAYYHRTRHLSCILENWSESESYNSLPIEITTTNKDESFNELSIDQRPMCWEAEDVNEYITTLDESCILDIESIESIDNINSKPMNYCSKSSSNNSIIGDNNMMTRLIKPTSDSLKVLATTMTTMATTTLTTAIITTPPTDHNQIMTKSGGPIEKYPRIMTTSCYGSLIDSFNSYADSAASDTMTEKEQQNQVNILLTADDTSYKQKLMSSSTEHLLSSQSQDFLYLNPPIVMNNQPKCRSPLPVSLTNSYCDGVAGGGASAGGGITSMTSSLYDPNKSMQSSMDLGALSVSGVEQRIDNSTYALPITMNSQSTINPLEMSMVSSQDGIKKNIKELVDTDLQAIRKLLETETGGAICPSCQMPFDKGKKRKLIDNCGHERCYSCLFKNEQCPVCHRQQQQQQREQQQQNQHQQDFSEDDEKNDILSCNNSMMMKLQDYDTGISGSTTTISPLGSPHQTQYRSNAKTNVYYCSNNNNNNNSNSSSRQQQQQQPQQAQINESQYGGPQNHHTSRLMATGGGVGGGVGSGSSVGLADITVHSCATPPQHRRRLFNPKSLRSPFGHRRPTNSSSASSSGYAENNSTLSDDEGGNVKPIPLNGKSKNSHDELQVRLGFFLQSNSRRNARNGVINGPQLSGAAQSCSSLASANTSPVSTLTGSSEADVSRVLQESNVYNQIGGCDSIGSLMSVSVSGNSNGSASPLSRRHSVTTAQPGQIEDLGLFKTRKSHIRRSARSAPLKEPHDPKIRFAQYRPAQLTLKPLFFEVPQQEPDPLYIGRSWLLRELSNTISTTETHGILISGNLGTGKTALILQLVEYSCFGRRNNVGTTVGSNITPTTNSDHQRSTIVTGLTSQRQQEKEGIICQINVAQDRMRTLASHVVAYHFCQADNNSTCLVPDFIHSIAAQLCQAPQLISYRDYIIGEPHLQNILSVRECIADPERAMKMGILEPLGQLKRTGKISAKNCLILIDALCEAEYHRPDHGDTISSFLAKMTEYFPPWLRIISTVRTQMLEFVKSLPYTRITLDNWTGNESLQKDICDYITFRINHSPSIQKNINSTKDSGQLRFTQYLHGLSKGSFLFAKLSLDLIERGYLVVKSSSYKVLPVSLAQIFLLHFNLRFPTISAYEKVSNIINVCLAALYPMTISEIYYAINALESGGPSLDWNEFLFRFNQLSGFLVKRIDNTYMFFHPSFREWLIRRDETESSKFLCDLRMGHAGIAFKLCRLHVPLDADQALEMGHHILKAHIYRSAPQHQSPRDMQSYWLSSVTNCVSSALCTLRNVYSPNLKVSRLLLLAGASPDFLTGFLGNAPILCIAAHEGNVPMVRLLLEFGANVELTNSQGCTPLILAASNGHCDVVRQLVAAGSAVGHTDTANRCALVHAARMNKLNIVKYLIACDWLPYQTNQQQTVSANNNTNALDDTITPVFNTNDVSLENAAQQALIAAALQGNTAIIEDLLDVEEIQINATDSLTGETALTGSSKNGCTETAVTLLSRGAIVDTVNKKGLTALLLAVKEGHWAVTDRLLQNQANSELKDPNGKTPLIVAAEEGHVGIIELLINRGATLDATDNEGLSALSWSCLRGRLQAAKCLAERNADIHHIDNTGRSPLDLAAYQGSAALVQMLLDRGGKIEHVDMNGMRPLDRAIACRNIQVVQVFLKRGAKLGPATWAMATGKPEILLLLLNKLLEDGNILYRKNRLQEAAHRYQYALRKIPLHTTFVEHSGTFLQLKVNFLLNHSRCKRKMNEFVESIDLASQAIELRPENYEGYYARAKAHMEINHTEDALHDAKLAVEHSKTTASIDIRKILIRLQDDLTEQSISDCSKLVTKSMDTITDL